MYLFTTYGRFGHVCMLYNFPFLMFFVLSLFLLHSWMKFWVTSALGNPLGHRKHKSGPCCRKRTPKKKRNQKTLGTMRTHTWIVRTHTSTMCTHTHRQKSPSRRFSLENSREKSPNLYRTCFKPMKHSTRFLVAKFTPLEVSLWINKLNLNFKDAIIPLGLSCTSHIH